MSLKGHLREIVLGVVLVAALFYWFLPSVPQGGDLSAQGGEPRAVTGTAASILNGPDVDLALLTQQPGDYDGGGRNLFDYGRILPPPPSAEELARRARLKEEARLLAEKERKRREEEQEKARLLELARQEKLAKDRANRPKPP
ncbi:MAG: hypothetical protein V3U11_12195, partial [Planctomycetota bacterium]